MGKAETRNAKESLDWRTRVAFESRRFNAWWEGYAFDAAQVRASLIAADADAVREAMLPFDQQIATAIWGEGRLEPGDAAWTMRHARTLGLPLKADVVLLGAGLGAPARDIRHGTRWRPTGYARLRERVRSSDVIPYDEAMSRINRGAADGGLCFFELHRDADPAMLATFAAELVKQNAPVAFVDFTVARKGARLKACFAEPWGGSPRQPDQIAETLEKSGFRVGDTIDETRAFLPLIARGWARWRGAYNLAMALPQAGERAAFLRLLGAYAHLWAERFDAIKAGQLLVTRFQTRRKG